MKPRIDPGYVHIQSYLSLCRSHVWSCLDSLFLYIKHQNDTILDPTSFDCASEKNQKILGSKLVLLKSLRQDNLSSSIPIFLTFSPFLISFIKILTHLKNVQFQLGSSCSTIQMSTRLSSKNLHGCGFESFYFPFSFLTKSEQCPKSGTSRRYQL